MYVQYTTVSGTIYDENNLPTPGVTIKIKNTNIGAVTDFDGQFKLEVPINSFIIISSIGYVNQEILINSKSQKKLTIQLEVSKEQLEEVAIKTRRNKNRRSCRPY